MDSCFKSCTVAKCETSACALCHCCQKDLCLDHLKEHRDLLNAQLVPLVHEANILKEKFDRFEVNSTPAYRTIEQWRQQAHQTVDAFCRRMYERVTLEKKEESKEQVQTVHMTLDLMIRRQGATRESIGLVTKSLNAAQQHFDELSKIQINLKPLTIDENLILVPNQVSAPKSNQVVQKIQQNINDGRGSVASNSPIPTGDLAALRNGSAFQIFFQFSGKTHTLVIADFDSILQIKQKITAKMGIPPEQQCLKFMGKILQDQHSVQLFGIGRDSTLDLSLLIRQPVDEQQRETPKIENIKGKKTKVAQS